MPEWRVPLVDVSVDELEIEAVVQTYRSGWLSMGPRTELLEQRFGDYTGASHAIAVSNCTAGLHLACAAAGLGEGDEAVVPSLTFVATANAVRYTGATPVFADIAGLDRPWIDADSVAAALGGRTQAIVNMTYGGHPADSAGLAALAAERGLVLIEDAAHGLGGALGGRALGTFGAIGAYSFFANKNLPVGEGGMVVSDDDEIAERVRLLRSHAMTSLTWDRHRGHASGYDVVELGFNYRIDEARAALAAVRLERLDADNARRAAAAARYRALLGEVEGLALTSSADEAAGERSAHHLFTVVLDPDRDRDGVRERMAERGVQTSVHYPPVHRFSAYDLAADLPLTDAYAERAISLPLFPGISDEQLELVADSLTGAL